MSKYAPNPKCTSGLCPITGEMCIDCAMDWKLRQTDKEMNILRRIEKVIRRSLAAGECTVELEVILRQLDTQRAKKPKLKRNS